MKLFIFGAGYTARHFARLEGGRFSRISATVRSSEKAALLAGEGIDGFVFNAQECDDRILQKVAASDAVLVTSQPASDGDQVLRTFGEALRSAPRLKWIGYLSTVGVYGDHQGRWVNEKTEILPSSSRSIQRAATELDWLAFGKVNHKAVQVFRLAGIYGPGRNAFVKLVSGTAQRLKKPGQVFNRTHVEDIAAALIASLGRPRAGAIYNVTDNEPAPPQDVVTFAAGLMKMEPPPERPFDPKQLSSMAVSFYGENKRVDNSLIKQELGLKLKYPTYREGLGSLFEKGFAEILIDCWSCA